LDWIGPTRQLLHRLLQYGIRKDPLFASRFIFLHANFGGATFAGNANFEGAAFADLAYFRSATFADRASFEGATFAGDA
jgi:Pentapeptide repeats (9 copies)